MIKTSTQKHLKLSAILFILGTLFFYAPKGFAQKTDSIKITLRGRATGIQQSINSKTPLNVPIFGTITSNTRTTAPLPKSDKNLSVSKIYPNPVSDQVNIIVRLEKESMLSIKILDMLSNEVVTLSNERTPAGEQTKSFTLPKRLNTGIYFIRLVAGQESVVKRISVL